MAYFPFYMDINDKPCLIVGGGKVALRKIEILLQFGAKLKVVSPIICDEIRKLPVSIIQREFNDDDINDMAFVVAGTNIEELNSHISKICKQRNILVNVVDVQRECSFIFPAIVKRDDMVISISTGGNSPAMAAKIRSDIETVVPDYYGELIETLGDYREYIKSNTKSEQVRKQIYSKLIGLAQSSGKNITFEMIQKEIDRQNAVEQKEN